MLIVKHYPITFKHNYFVYKLLYIASNFITYRNYFILDTFNNINGLETNIFLMTS